MDKAESREDREHRVRRAHTRWRNSSMSIVLVAEIYGVTPEEIEDYDNALHPKNRITLTLAVAFGTALGIVALAVKGLMNFVHDLLGHDPDD